MSWTPGPRRTPGQLLPFLPLLLALGLAYGLGTAYLLGWLPDDGSIQVGQSSDWDWHLTEVEACAVQWSAGILPEWNPWTAAGIPLLSSPEVPAFYPLSWAAAIWGSVPAVRWGTVVHLALLGAGLGALCLVLGGSWMAPIVVVLGLATSDFLMVRVGHGHFIHLTLAWLPIGLLGVAGRWRPGLAGLCAGIGVAGPCLGGGPYPTWMAFSVFVAWCLLRAGEGRGIFGPLAAMLVTWIALLGLSPWLTAPLGIAAAAAVVHWQRRHATERTPEPLGPTVRTFVWGGVFIALLAAPKWLTTAAAIHDSPRLARLDGFEALTGQTLDPWTVFRAVFLHSPELWPIGGMEGAHEAFPLWFTPLFLVLGIVGGLALARSRPVLGMLTVLVVAFSVGHNLPVNLFGLVTSVPPFDRFNEPQRWGMVWVPLLALLSGFAWDALTAGRWRPLRIGALALVLAAHGSWGLENMQYRGRIAWPTGGTYERARLEAPTAVVADVVSNWESIRLNRSCLDCGDPLGQTPPPELQVLPDDVFTGDPEVWRILRVERPDPMGVVGMQPTAHAAFRITPRPREFDWAPGRITFVAATSGDHALPIANRRGWRAHADGERVALRPGGDELAGLQGSAPLLVVQGVQAGQRVVVRYRTPALWPSLVMFALGVGAAGVVLRRRL